MSSSEEGGIIIWIKKTHQSAKSCEESSGSDAKALGGAKEGDNNCDSDGGNGD